jgi:hypothetical protein
VKGLPRRGPKGRPPRGAGAPPGEHLVPVKDGRDAFHPLAYRVADIVGTARAFGLEIDELIRANRQARNTLADLEHATDEEIDTLERELHRIRARARRGGGPAARSNE